MIALVSPVFVNPSHFAKNAMPTVERSDSGPAPEAHLSLVRSWNPLRIWSPHLTSDLGLRASAALVCLLLGLSLLRRLKFLIFPAWLLFECLADFHGGMADVSYGFLGWMSLSLAWIHPQDADLESRLVVFRPVAWLIFGLAYTASGWAKWMHGLSWREGTALRLILENDLMVRPMAQKILHLPGPILQVMTWAALAAEFSGLMLCWVPGLRWLSWIALSGLQFGLAYTLDLGWLNYGLLVFHAWIAAASFRVAANN